MAWAKVGDEWWSHPKVLDASNAACGLWIRALSWSCHQRRDIVPCSFVRLVNGTDAETAELVDRGLWIAVDGGWRIHDWAEYQEKSLSEKRAEAGTKGGRASKTKQTDFASEANGQAGPSLPVPSLPVPTQPEAETRTLEAVKPKGPTRAPKDLPVTESMRRWADENGIAADLEMETEQFLDWHRSKGRTAKDWTAAWRNWMRNTKKWQPVAVANGHDPQLNEMGQPER